MQGENTLATPMQTVTAAQPLTHHHRTALFHHETPRHQPRNVNMIHAAEKAASGINQKIAIGLTKGVGTMVCAYIFAILAIIGFPGFSATPTQYVQWISQTFIQLVMLSVIMVGQAVLGRKQELQADEQFNTTANTYHDIEQIMQHLSAQDEELLRHAKMLEHLLEKNGIDFRHLETQGGDTSHLETPMQQPLVNAAPAMPAAVESTN
ncbi:MAG TPA: hypothetical protein VGD98_26270 [Ktedonobacteraceae bacterium]